MDLKAIIQQQGHKETHIEAPLLSQTYQKLAAWSFEWKTGPSATEKLNDKSYEEILNYIQKSTEINQHNYDAWHHFSHINYEASLYYSDKFTKETEDKIALLIRIGMLPKNQANIQVYLHKTFGHKCLPKLD